MSESKLTQIRREKHRSLNGGSYPLANGAFSKIDILLDLCNSLPAETPLDPAALGTPLTVRGRIAALRRSGGITFIKVFDGTGSIQLIATKAVLADYTNLTLLDLGDIVEIIGQLCRSKTGERSILINSWSLLTKSILPPPEKWVGLVNVETKYRQRYLDLMSSEESRAVFTVRSHVLRALRSFMEDKGFMEVETSTLNAVSSGANATPFVTHHKALDTNLFLRIAPEPYLKRLLVGGFDKVFEIGRNYRNEGLSTRHNPEFTMMEFYEAYANFDKLLVYTQDMLSYVEQYLTLHMENTFVYPYLQKWASERTFTFSRFSTISMWAAVELAASKAGISINEETLMVEIVDLGNERLQSIKIAEMFHDLEEAVLPGEKIVILFEYLAEPFLTVDYTHTENGKALSVPVFVTDYPSDVCPLARTRDSNPDVCDRFELFVNGMELCNAFQELNNPDEQAAKFKDQLESNQKDPMGYDADYIEALSYGMPPAIGFGMGIERLVMLITNTQSIKDVILFPTLKKENT